MLDPIRINGWTLNSSSLPGSTNATPFLAEADRELLADLDLAVVVTP
ncbi:hypothetical protein [Streptomyces massasporeus]